MNNKNKIKLVLAGTGILVTGYWAGKIKAYVTQILFIDKIIDGVYPHYKTQILKTGITETAIDIIDTLLYGDHEEPEKTEK